MRGCCHCHPPTATGCPYPHIYVPRPYPLQLEPIPPFFLKKKTSSHLSRIFWNEYDIGVILKRGRPSRLQRLLLQSSSTNGSVGSSTTNAVLLPLSAFRLIISLARDTAPRLCYILSECLVLIFRRFSTEKHENCVKRSVSSPIFYTTVFIYIKLLY
jgi:hypothetical protein